MTHHIPAVLEAIEKATVTHGFTMPSDRETGSLLKSLAASKPDGRFLEIGTGTGLGSAWLLAGMNERAHLDSVDNDPVVQAIARQSLDSDPRVTFHISSGDQFIEAAKPSSYDFIFADAWPGKYSHLNETLQLLRTGGIYFIDDMLPQPNWPAGHDQHVNQLLDTLKSHPNLAVCQIEWSTGIVLCTKVA